MTTERTAAIINRCISTHLQQCLGAPQVPPKDAFRKGLPQASPKSPEHLPLPQHQRPSRGRSASSSDTREKADGGDRAFESSSYPFRNPFPPAPPPKDAPDHRNAPRHVAPREHGRPHDSGRKERHPYIFRELEDYIISGFRGCDILNASFNSGHQAPRPAPENTRPEPDPGQSPRHAYVDPVVELDAKTLLVGDLAENSSWWMADEESGRGPSHAQSKPRTTKTVNSRSPRINWTDVDQWYQLILRAGTSWVEKWSTMKPLTEEDPTKAAAWDMADLSVIEKEMTESRAHLHRTLLKATEGLLKRPRRPLKKPDDIRFLLILLSNPLIYPPTSELASLTVPRGERGPSRPGESNTGRPMGNQIGRVHV